MSPFPKDIGSPYATAAMLTMNAYWLNKLLDFPKNQSADNLKMVSFGKRAR